MKQKIRGFSSVIEDGTDGNIILSPSGTPHNETCDWNGCNQIWAVKVWRVMALNENGLANTPPFENVLLCEKHEIEGCKAD
jgi:hypothetical protein